MLDFICTLAGELKDALWRMRSTAIICLEKLSFLQNKDQQSFTSVLEKSLLWTPLFQLFVYECQLFQITKMSNLQHFGAKIQIFEGLTLAFYFWREN